MVDKREALETWSGIWSAVPSGKRWNLGGAALGLAVLVGTTAGWAGFQIRGIVRENELIALRMEQAGELQELRQRLAEAQQPSRAEQRLMLSTRTPLDEIPTFADAPVDETPFAEFSKSYAEHLRTHADSTALQTPNFFKMHSGKRFKWSGVVEEVSDVHNGEIAVALIVLAELDFSFLPTEREQPRYNPECLFDAGDRETLSKLKIGEEVEVAGVLDRDGRLRRCKLIRVQPRGPYMM